MNSWSYGASSTAQFHRPQTKFSYASWLFLSWETSSGNTKLYNLVANHLGHEAKDAKLPENPNRKGAGQFMNEKVHEFVRKHGQDPGALIANVYKGVSCNVVQTRPNQDTDLISVRWHGGNFTSEDNRFWMCS